MSSKDTSKEPPEVAEFQKELYSLFDSKTASASKIDRVTKLAFKSARYYKNIVYCLEKFITRCVPEYKLTGLYVLDSISRTSQNVKTKSSSGSFTGSEYVGRFERNIEALFAEFCKVQEDKEKEKVKRVVDLWERSGTFAPTIIENIKKKYFPLLESAKSLEATAPETTTAVTVAATDKEPQESSADKAASLISSLAASLAQASENGGALSILQSLAPASTPAAPPSMPATTTSTISTAPSSSAPLIGISDPSSALALQTLLATVSQVKAATAGSFSAAGTGYHQPPYPPSAAPSVLQQLQVPYSNSNQNMAHVPNNNTMVPGTVAPPFLHNDPRNGTGMYPTNENAAGGTMPTPMQLPGTAHTQVLGRQLQQGQGFDGASGVRQLNAETGPRGFKEPTRVDPRLAYQQQQQQPGSQQSHMQTAQPQQKPHQTQPPLPSHVQVPTFDPSNLAHASVTSFGVPPPNAPSFLGPNFDGQTMAKLASLLNPSKDGSGSIQPLRFPLPIAPQVPNDSTGQERGSRNTNMHTNEPQVVDNLPRAMHAANGHHLPPRPSSTELKEVPAIGSDKIRVISRTLWVGGTFIPTISEQELETIFAPKGKIATLMINPAKFNAFIKMADRAQAERCKAELDRTMVQGEVMKVGWGCGFGPRDCFDYTSGASVIPLDRLTDTDKRWLTNSVVGGFGLHEPIRGGIELLEPNIEPVGPDGREALPRRGKSFVAGRGRGRGVGSMDHSESTGASLRGRGGGGVGGVSVGRGRGFQGGSEQRMNAFPSHSQPGFHNHLGSEPSWQGKRDFFHGPGQEAMVGSGAPMQQQQQQHRHPGQEEESKRNKKSRWE
ncbi:hypothetical protein BGZ51_006738 [Haplosporangium sp. Z 767]|nr:hypothetical protein BGZ51_006738 [Haplosporangium sp. Z 767]